MAVSHFINSFNWKNTFDAYSIDDAAMIFNHALLNAFDTFIPRKIFRTPKFPRWVNRELKNLIFQKGIAHANFKQSNLATDYLNFSEIRPKC